ncbi:MAG: MFS transporter [Hyphomicrobiales bacterium]|nr:MFS transporter [Hyphomicrobiales bacterium]
MNDEAAQKAAWRLVLLVCIAQTLVQIGAFFWPALLPQLAPTWALSNSAAGWITAAFYGAYMLAVPVLVTLTDRVDPKRLYLLGVGLTIIGHLLFGWLADGFWSALACRALAGVGWAGTYMTGLKLLADRVDARMMSRATAGHAASIGLSGAASFATGELLARQFGWQAAFLLAALSAALAWIIIAAVVPRQDKVTSRPKDGGGLYDFRPVLRNRSAMAYAMAYCIHTLEMSALRGWGVAFLAYVAASAGTQQPILSPAVLVTLIGLVGTAASLLGNEAAIRFGRRRLVHTAMLGSVVLGSIIGFVGPLSYALAAALILLYGLTIWLDSSSLTAGAAGTAEPSRRGATLAVHSTLGYAGGFIGPPLIGWVLDAGGGMSQTVWGIAFASVALLMLGAFATFVALRPDELAGDKGK